MRKKSHILLARYMADQFLVEDSLQTHRKAFCLGSILPDIKPSFLTTRHEFCGTFEQVQKEMLLLIENGKELYSERAFWRKVGEVLHYIADYFTFPHNHTYEGSLLAHNYYEKELRNSFRDYIQNGKALRGMKSNVTFDSFSELCCYVQGQHEKYVCKMRNIGDDIRYILDVCFHVLQGLLQLCAVYAEKPVILLS